MHRTFLALVVCAAVSTAPAHNDQHKDGPKVKVLSQKDVAEKVDGKKARATTVEVTFEPGQASAPHRHPGPVFGYVIEGEYEWAIDDQPARTLKAGDTFYEPTGCLHRVSRNPRDKTRTRVLAVCGASSSRRQGHRHPGKEEGLNGDTPGPRPLGLDAHFSRFSEPGDFLCPDPNATVPVGSENRLKWGRVAAPTTTYSPPL